MRGVRAPTGRLLTAAAALLVTGAVAGCQAQPGANGAPVRISKAPQQAPTSLPESSEPPQPKPTVTKTTPTPTPSRTTRTPEPVQPVAQTVLGPGARGERVRELQARLRQIDLFGQNPTGYYGTVTSAAVSAFQKQRGLPRTGKVTDTLLRALRDRTDAPKRDELYPPTSRPLSKPDPRCTTGRALCVSKESRTLAWMVNGEVRAAMDVRFGSAYTPTREGLFKVDFKSRDHHSTLYDTPMPYALFFSRGQAIHFSSDFAARGYTGASHGCVNVRDKKKLAKVFAEVRKGDKVVVYK